MYDDEGARGNEKPPVDEGRMPTSLQHRQMFAAFGMNQIAAALQNKITAS